MSTKFFYVALTGELLESLIAPVFNGHVPEGVTIIKVSPSSDMTYGFNVVFTADDDEIPEIPEGGMIQPYPRRSKDDD